MSISLYASLIEEIIEKGEVKISLTDCDAQFYLEDVLNERGIQYKKILPLRNTNKAIKFILYKIQLSLK
ncbi:hypothetical protein [Bacillus sp. V5-8f]|uniref:hypothetical protein n=1 Tax=Bacillus sp. V5-8f TaxID=2053044 RepID=UPI000C75E411|nr:hypothetical protein [Bacillus sp. V5-8f]PLT33658.1 hypothetical protein CUU64_11045 [Bacillus sp. V5-8f]